jgi:hypothetical protein
MTQHKNTWIFARTQYPIKFVFLVPRAPRFLKMLPCVLFPLFKSVGAQSSRLMIYFLHLGRVSQSLNIPMWTILRMFVGLNGACIEYLIICTARRISIPYFVEKRYFERTFQKRYSHFISFPLRMVS